MSKKSKFYVTPSPNEMEMRLHEQMKQRRRIRLMQVRQQGSDIAKDIRSNVDRRRRHVLEDIAAKLNEQQVQNQQKQFYTIKEKYSNGLKDFGVAHADGLNMNPDQALSDAIYEQEKATATKRYCNAINALHLMQSMEKKDKIAKLNHRKLVAHKENIRAKRIAMLPKSERNSDEENPSQSTKSTASSRSSGISQNSRSCFIVERATSSEHNAYDDAKVAAQKEEEIEKDRQQSQISAELLQKERAKFRHLAALRETRMHNEYVALQNQLKVLQKKDAVKRREALSYIPQMPSLDVSLQDLMV